MGEEDVARHLERLGEAPEARDDAAKVVLEDREAVDHEALGLLPWLVGERRLGVMTPASSAAAAVKTLRIEPGT